MKSFFWHLFVVTCSLVSFTFAKGIYHKDLDVTNYKYYLSLDVEQKVLTGQAEISLIVKSLNDSLGIDLYDNMKVTSFKINGSKAGYKHYNNKVVFVNNFRISDSIVIFIEYKGTPSKAGLTGFSFGKINGKSVVYNLSEPFYASTWLPCNDTSVDKAYLDIKIENDSQFTSVSNGQFFGKEILGSRAVYHWRSNYPISTYLIAIYSAVYKNFNDTYISQDGKDTMEVKYYALPEHYESAKIDWADHPKMIEVFSKMFGEYAFIKDKYGVAEFLWYLGAMEHQTITGIGQNFVGGKNMFQDVYIHELSHHWWGDAIAPGTFNDVWLNEGFATYSEALYVEKVFGNAAFRVEMLNKYDKHFKGVLYKPGEDYFSILQYNKGAWVLHMLRWEVGDSSFFNILRTYFNRFKYKSAETKDFKELCEEITGKNLEEFFRQWVYEGDGILELSYKKELIDNKLNLTLEQIQRGYNTYKLTLPIKIYYSNGESEVVKINLKERKQTEKIELKGEFSSIAIDPENWLLLSLSNDEKSK